MTDQPTGPAGPGGPPAAGQPGRSTCYRHPDREAYIRCARCDRTICPDCMVEASVGFQCPECVRAGNEGRREWRTQFGGRTSADPGYVTKVLIGVNVVAFVLQQLPGLAFTNRLWLIGEAFDPVLGTFVGVADGEVYRLLTGAFLHGGLLHIAFNMYALWLFGPQLEAAFGRSRFLGLYLMAALGGTATSYAFGSLNTPSLGASGAVFGLFGAYLVLSRRLRRDASGLWVLLGINFVLGFVVANIDWRAHVGGLIAGAAASAIVVYAPANRRTLVQVVGFLLVLAAVVALVGWRTLQLAS